MSRLVHLIGFVLATACFTVSAEESADDLEHSSPRDVESYDATSQELEWRDHSPSDPGTTLLDHSDATRALKPASKLPQRDAAPHLERAADGPVSDKPGRPDRKWMDKKKQLRELQRPVQAAEQETAATPPKKTEATAAD